MAATRSPSGSASPWAISLALSALGLAALVAGLAMLSDTSIGLEWGRLPAILLELAPTTLPATLLVLAASAVNLGAGSIAVRALAGRPYRTVTEAVLGGMTGAVLIDAALMMALGSVDAFRWPVIGAILGAILLAPIAWPSALRPILRPRLISRRTGTGWVAPWLLAAVIWCLPLILILAAPIVTWNDVPANHVAPPEHLRFYGSLDPLTTSPSPRYAASRNFLGYIAFHGTLATLTDLPAARSVVAFVIPLTALVALACTRLSGALFGRAAGQWALLTVPLTFVFLRLPDSRATVTAFPIVIFALLVLLRSPRHPDRRHTATLAAGLAATILMHPVIGAFGVATAVLLVVAEPSRYARRAIPGIVGGLTLALPQAAVMLDIGLPSAVGPVAIPAAAAVALIVEEVAGRVPPLPAESVRMWLALAALLVLVVGAVTVAGGVVATIGAIGQAFPLLMVMALLGALLLRRRRQGLLVVGAAGGAWLVGAAIMAIAPLPSAFLEAIRFEVPKSFGYWTPVWLAVVAAGGLAQLSRKAVRGRWAAYPILGLFVLAAALPLREGVIHPSELLEHRFAESLSVSASFAQRGYWQGYPDTRLLTDAPGLEIVGFLRSEQRAGSLTADGRVLHVARASSEATQVPIGVFTGALEWLASEEPDRSFHGDPRRQPHVADLPSLLGPAFAYVVVEPAGLASDPTDAILAAGYERLFENDRAIVFRHRDALPGGDR